MMMDKNKTQNQVAFMSRPGQMEFGIVPMPDIGENDVLVQIEWCGICGSDIHYYEYGRIGDYVVNGDFILGHEVAGTVVQTGSEVKTLSTGDRVALEPGIPCGKCEMCRQGKYNLCKDVVFFATPPVQGALQRYVRHPADMCFRLPDGVSTRYGAVVEPLSVGLHACAQGGVKLGDDVVILGSGCIGLCTLLAAKASGASRVIVADLFEKRLAFAKKLGADFVVNSKSEDLRHRVCEIFGERGADVVLETAGASATIYQSAYLAKAGGTVVLVGISVEGNQKYSFNQVMGKELTIKSVFRYRNCYPVAIRAIASGKIDVEQIVTHEFPFEETPKAFDTVISDAQNVVKGIIRF